MAREKLGKWLTVEELGIAGRKTKVWVIEGSDGSPLGQVRWYTAWRQYAFMPSGHPIVMNRTCLADLSGFLDRETQKHMEMLTAQKDSR